MTEIVSNVGEPSASGSDRCGNCQSFFQRKVGRVWFVAQGVDNENGDTSEVRDNFLWYVVAVTEVGGELLPFFRENVAVNKNLAVRDLGGCDFNVADAEGV